MTPKNQTRFDGNHLTVHKAKGSEARVYLTSLERIFLQEAFSIDTLGEITVMSKIEKMNSDNLTFQEIFSLLKEKTEKLGGGIQSVSIPAITKQVMRTQIIRGAYTEEQPIPGSNKMQLVGIPARTKRVPETIVVRESSTQLRFI